MNRSKQLLLTCTVLALQASAFAAHARQAEACREFPIDDQAVQSALLVNSGSRPVTLALSFQPASDAGVRRACGTVSLAAGHSADARALAGRCHAAPDSSGVVRACIAPRVLATAAHGVPTGELGADLLANNLAVSGR